MSRKRKIRPQEWVKVEDYHGGHITQRGPSAFVARLGVLDPATGKKKRMAHSASSLADCEAWVDSQQGGRQPLDQKQYAEAVEAFRLLGKHKLLDTVRDALAAYDRLKGQNMISIIELGLKASKVKVCKVAAAVEDFLAFMRSRVADGLRSSKTVAEYARYLGKFAAAFGDREVFSIVAADVEVFLRDNWQDKITSRNNAYRALSAFFSFCVKNKWVSRNDNPFAEDLAGAKQDLQELHRRAMEDADILYLSPQEAARLLAAAIRNDEPMVPWLLVCLFLGVRPSEASRLRGAQFFLFDEHPRLELPRQVTKTQTKRTIDLAKPVFKGALQWLKAYVRLKPDEELRPWKGRNVISAHQTKLFALAGISEKRQQDILRHTAATYLAPLLADAEYVGVMGHSKDVSRVHYDAKTVEAEAREFFALSPTSLFSVAGRDRSDGATNDEEKLRRRMDADFAQMEQEEVAERSRVMLHAQAVLADPNASEDEKKVAQETLIGVGIAEGNLFPEDVGWGETQTEEKPEPSAKKSTEKPARKPGLSRKEFLRTVGAAEPSKR